MKFKEGDRVIASRKGLKSKYKNMVGTVVSWSEGGEYYYVDLDASPFGNDNAGTKGWIFDEEDMRFLTPLERFL